MYFWPCLNVWVCVSGAFCNQLNTVSKRKILAVSTWKIQGTIPHELLGWGYCAAYSSLVWKWDDERADILWLDTGKEVVQSTAGEEVSRQK